MNCCGKKRQAWLMEEKAPQSRPAAEVHAQKAVTDQPTRWFEYTGNKQLTIKGIGTGTPYHFQFKGDKLAVDYRDSFAFMAERELKVTSADQESRY
jgi:1,4-alpha-glucan branching enzyme